MNQRASFNKEFYNNFRKENFGNFFNQNTFSQADKRKRYCEVLGVDENFTEEQLKIQYRTLIKKYHPDTVANDEKKQKQFEIKVKEINEAYHF